MIGKFLNAFADQTRCGERIVRCPLDFKSDFLKMDKPHHTQNVLREMPLLKR
jgi:hypothetical protein